MTKLKTIQDVKSVRAETLAYQVYQSDVDLATLTQNVIRAISKHIKPVRDERMNEYTTGDPLCYPPDWYDQYVFPLDTVITMCDDEIQSRYEDSEDESEW